MTSGWKPLAHLTVAHGEIVGVGRGGGSVMKVGFEDVSIGCNPSLHPHVHIPVPWKKVSLPIYVEGKDNLRDYKRDVYLKYRSTLHNYPLHKDTGQS